MNTIDHPLDQLSAYVDHELDESEHERVDFHLDECESCRALTAELTEMRSLIANAYQSIEAPVRMEQHVMSIIEQRSSDPMIASFGLTAVPIAGLLLLFLVLYLYGSVALNFLSITFSFIVTSAHVFSHIASSTPVMWGAIFLIAIFVFLLSGLSLRRILRGTMTREGGELI
ncbi:anti-sigma factor family protein [Cohnella yongneupensis]|uniref:Anti-sigma-W factor RsiW n=1 Tax=Cohnella yongneupensis TaxID=425006 RepID=A0ABW0QZF3_9BACL